MTSPVFETRVRRASLTVTASASGAGSSLPNALHHQLLNVGTRSRAQSAPSIEFHDALLKGDTARKSMRTFKDQAKDMLRAILLALMFRMLLVAIVITPATTVFDTFDEATANCEAYFDMTKQPLRVSRITAAGVSALMVLSYDDEVFVGIGTLFEDDIKSMATFYAVKKGLKEIADTIDWLEDHEYEGEDDLITSACNKLIGSITSKALKIYAKTAEANLRNVIREQLQTPFGLFFDRWTCNAIHFCAIYAVYVVDGVCKQPLLAIAKMGDGQTASAHVEKFEEVLQLYDRSNDDIRFLVGDNCSTNQAIANLMKIPFVGCASHRLNLAVNKFLEENKHVINKVQELMVALRKPNTNAHLERTTRLHAQIANSTRWTSVYMMPKHYLELRDAARQIVTLKNHDSRAIGAPKGCFYG
ncbi:hypothetical protein P43SY_006436 [Pythium insidiosum]|uniref:Uncharacterized protein n=1 Tax=Pythium insidiosum TaxID=114742 RepID=A0AAD5MAU9_PYTIN|nr:hypothetical protein P43SY_006436 [Pythium insidiosum]